MEQTNDVYTTRLPVRGFVEFLCRSGNLDNRKRKVDTQAMNEGIKLHQKIQKSKPEYYEPEVPITSMIPTEYDGEPFLIILDGRADGVMHFESITDKLLDDNKELLLHETNVYIDEIKCMYADVEAFKEPETVHLAQAKCYAWHILKEENLDEIGVQITYCNIETVNIKYFTYIFKKEEIEDWMNSLAKEYAKWLCWRMRHEKRRDESIKQLEFPFEYRPSQRDLVKNVYLTLLRKKKIYVEAPTGVGKTISTVFPAVKALGEGLAKKVFYVTARTITRTVAEETAVHLKNNGLDMLNVTLTAKDKLCILDKPDCNPESCERAKGHEDRVNDAVYDLITNETDISRDIILKYAEKHNVCPFEFCLDVSLWCDMIIGDYNYCFDPDVYLRRFFYESNVGKFILLVDEAHNLVDRAREMYSASLSKDELLKIKPLINKERKDLRNRINKLNRCMLELKNRCEDGLTVFEYEEYVSLFVAAEKLYEKLLAYVTDRKVKPDEEVMDFFFELRTFVLTNEVADENYVYTASKGNDGFYINLNCMNPKARMREYLQYFRGTAFFSATLLPVKYYMDQLAADEEDYAVYSPSSFDPNNRKIFITRDVSAKYSRRGQSEYEKMAEYIRKFVIAKTGNYLVFFPSYKVMNEVYSIIKESDSIPEEIEIPEEFISENDITLLDENNNLKTEAADDNIKFKIYMQSNSMSESAREEFLEKFQDNPTESVCGFCVMGGIFSEGIDLKADRLIGVAIVGTGLPMVGDERELYKNYYDDMNGKGFEYSYLYPGMNKVLQAGGRVIRTATDVGVILLMDDRFMNSQYRNLFPQEWEGYETTDITQIDRDLKKFWETK